MRMRAPMRSHAKPGPPPMCVPVCRFEGKQRLRYWGTMNYVLKTGANFT